MTHRPDKKPSTRPASRPEGTKRPLGTIRASELERALRDPENARTLAEARRIFKESGSR
jgi:hypothetical protein